MCGVEKTFTQEQVDAAVAEATKDALTQEKVDSIVQDRLGREKAKYSEYDNLVKFKADHEKKAEENTQKELEAQKEYEKLKEGFVTKEAELQTLITNKDSEISSMKIGNALMSEIVKQNAYVEETMALLKSQVVFDKDGNIRVKGLDANGLETMLSVEEGIKKFLEKRPHLVKATKKDGGGTPPGGGGGGGGGEGGDLNSLNAELLQAQQIGDRKKIEELKGKMRAALQSKKSAL